MAVKTWTTVFPANLDTLTQQPVLNNLVDDIDNSHPNTLSRAVRALEVLVGSDNVETGSLRALVNEVPETTFSNLNSKVTDATLIDSTDARLSNERSASAFRGRTVATSIPSSGQVYIWNETASEWQPGEPLAELASLSLASLNSKVTDATLIDTADSRLSDARTPTAHTHVQADVTDFSHDHVRADITDFTHTHAASDVTDFDTEVGNHADVAANTTHRGLTNNPHSVGASDVGNTTAQWNANQIQGRDVSAAAPSSGQVLKWDGANISWDTDAGGVTDFVNLTDTPSGFAGDANKYVAVNAGENALEFITPPTIINNFTGLSDTPSGYAGAEHFHVRVNAAGDALELVAPSGVAGATQFTNLTDTPSGYATAASKYVAVNVGESALEFVTPPTIPADLTDLGDTPANYSGYGDYFVKVKTDQTGVEFVAPSGAAGSSDFVSLTDTPANYNAAGHNIVRVKDDLTGLEFVAPSGINFDEAFTTLTDTPANYSGAGGNMLVVNTAEDAVEFSGIRRVLEDTFTADSPDVNDRQTFTLTVTTAANADTPSGRDIRGVFRNGNKQKHVGSNPDNREYTMPANNQVTIGGLVTDDEIEITYGG